MIDQLIQAILDDQHGEKLGRIVKVVHGVAAQERRQCAEDVCEYCRDGSDPQFEVNLWGGSWVHRTPQGWRRCHAAGILKRCQGQI